MNQAESVTDFKLEVDGKQITHRELITELNKHCKALLQGESFCCPDDWGLRTENGGERREPARIPSRYRWLVAYAVEGENEGWYVHVGAIIQPKLVMGQTTYEDFGFCKVWSVEDSFAVQKEAQRFLTAARWN